MADWDDMVDMGYGNADGTLTDYFYESCEDDEETTSQELVYEFLEVELTPSQYLASNEKYMRAKIINNTASTDWNDFELMHDKLNDYDSLAIQLFYNEIFIGYIKKSNTKFSESDINNFCFRDSSLLKISINWINNSFQIRRVLTEEIKHDREKESKRLAELENQRKLLEEKNLQKEKIEANNENLKKKAIESLYAKKSYWDGFNLREDYLIELPKRIGINGNLIKVIDQDISCLEKQDFGSFDKSGLKLPEDFSNKLERAVLGYSNHVVPHALPSYFDFVDPLAFAGEIVKHQKISVIGMLKLIFQKK